MKTPLNFLVSFPPNFLLLRHWKYESRMMIWAPFSRAVCGFLQILQSRAPSGQSTGQDIYQQHHWLPGLTCGSAHSVLKLSCLFNPRHMRVTRANPVARQKPCCVFVEQLLGSWCTAVAGLVWKWRVTWYFNLFFSLRLLFPPAPFQTDIADNNCFWRVPASEIEMRILNWGVEFMKILLVCKECNFCFV